jgi:hypothetical protein
MTRRCCNPSGLWLPGCRGVIYIPLPEIILDSKRRKLPLSGSPTMSERFLYSRSESCDIENHRRIEKHLGLRGRHRQV